MSRSIGAAVIGLGFIGPVHVEALRRLGVQVVGVLGSSPKRARPKADQLGIERVYANIGELVSDPAVDVVHVTSPNLYHYSQAKAALQAGKHVVCEKPLAMNTAESAELVSLARAKKLVNAVNFNVRFYPLNLQARQLVTGGELGDVYMVRGHYAQDWLLFDTDWNWRLDIELSGKLRTVGDIGSHWLDLTSFITGLKVRRVFADLHTFLPLRRKPAGPIETFSGERHFDPENTQQQVIETEDYATILLQYESGARGVVTLSQMSAGRKNQLVYEINGSKKSLAWNGERPNELWLGNRNAPNQRLIKDPTMLAESAAAFSDYPAGHAEGYPDTFKQLYRAVYTYIDAGDFDAPPNFPTFADGHEGMALVEAIGRSARQEQWVEVTHPPKT